MEDAILRTGDAMERLSIVWVFTVWSDSARDEFDICNETFVRFFNLRHDDLLHLGGSLLTTALFLFPTIGLRGLFLFAAIMDFMII